MIVRFSQSAYSTTHFQLHSTIQKIKSNLPFVGKITLKASNARGLFKKSLAEEEVVLIPSKLYQFHRICSLFTILI
jgi:hypothetical protein